MVKKIPDVSGFMTTTVFNTKIEEVDHKIPYLSSLFQKTDEKNAKTSEFEGKYFTTSGYNKFVSDILDTKIKQKG